MKHKIHIPDSILKQLTYRKRYTLTHLYIAYTALPKAIKILRKNKVNKTTSFEFLERIQLAVTEVNGCAVCSYAHTKMALNMGMNETLIFNMLDGNLNSIEQYETFGILYAQHFADQSGKPDPEMVSKLIEIYGKISAINIHSACQVMLAGNIYGLPMSAFISRVKKQPYTNSSLRYELFMLSFGLLIFPFGILHGIFKKDELNTSN
jgi:AhpD family alkylhydroperoxidase